MDLNSRQIGSLAVSEIGLGTNNFGGRMEAAPSKVVVDTAIEAGVNFFDTADVYGGSLSEQYLGQALGTRRKEVLVATKFGNPFQGGPGGASPEYVRQAADGSLQRLGTDYIDLFQLHRPDPKVPIAETLGALAELVEAGKVRELGCSNFSVDQLREAAAAAGDGPRFVSVQNHYSLLHRQPESDGVLEECQKQGIAFLPYFPLANGLLSGKYSLDSPPPKGTRLAGMPAERLASVLNEESLSKVERLADLAERQGHTILELAFAWLLARPQVASVIAGATRPEQVKANAAAAGWQLGDDLLQQIDEIAPIQ